MFGLNLDELGREYIARADCLYRRCERLELDVKRTRGEASIRLTRRIRFLYEDADRCRVTGLRLLHYYDRDWPPP